MIIKKLLLLILMVGILSLDLSAQSFKQGRRFKAAVLVGVNLAQIDGDKHAGYDKAGLQAGLRGITILTDELELSFELLFNQKGSRSKDITEPFNRPGARRPLDMRLNYMEVPVLLNYRFEKLDRDFYKFEVHGGVSYGRLLDFKIEESLAGISEEDIFAELAETFKRSEISLILGFRANVSRHLGFALRHSVGLNQYYKNRNATEFQVKGLRNYFFSLMTIYSF